MTNSQNILRMGQILKISLVANYKMNYIIFVHFGMNCENESENILKMSLIFRIHFWIYFLKNYEISLKNILKMSDIFGIHFWIYFEINYQIS